MRAKAGDPPRTMPQKILVGRTEDARLEEDIVRVRVDQVILAREPNDILREAADWGSSKSAVETAVVYDTRCVTGDCFSGGAGEEGAGRATQEVTRSFIDSFVDSGLVIARAGIGFPSAVHLERFAAPGGFATPKKPRPGSRHG